MHFNNWRRAGLVCFLAFLFCACAKGGDNSASTTVSGAPRMEATDQVIEQGISRHNIPGAVLLVERGGKTVYFKAYGDRSVQPAVAAMTADAIFDLASLSKCVGCAPSIM